MIELTAPATDLSLIAPAFGGEISWQPRQPWLSWDSGTWSDHAWVDGWVSNAWGGAWAINQPGPMDVMGNAWINRGGYATDKVVYRWPLASGAFDGTGEIVAAPSPRWNIGANDFTFNFSIYSGIAGSNNGTQYTFSILGTYWITIVAQRLVDGTGFVIFQLLDVAANESLLGLLSYMDAFEVDTWYDIEIGRSGSNAYISANGVQLSVNVTAGDVDVVFPDIVGFPTLGSDSSNTSMIGNLDEFMFSNGICRHTADFTPGPLVVDEYTVSLIHFDDALIPTMVLTAPATRLSLTAPEEA